MSEKPEASPPPLERALALAAPAILVGGAFLYFAGWTYNRHFFQLFGLPDSAISRNLQQTMADGFGAIMSDGPLVAFALVSILLFISFIHYHALHWASKYIDEEVRVNSFNFAFIGSCIIGFLLFGYATGVVSSKREASRLSYAVRDGCKKCSFYVTSVGQFVGIAVAQDERSTVFITRQGAIVLPAGAIRSVRRINPLRPLPSWMVPDL